MNTNTSTNTKSIAVKNDRLFVEGVHPDESLSAAIWDYSTGIGLQLVEQNARYEPCREGILFALSVPQSRHQCTVLFWGGEIESMAFLEPLSRVDASSLKDVADAVMAKFERRPCAFLFALHGKEGECLDAAYGRAELIPILKLLLSPENTDAVAPATAIEQGKFAVSCGRITPLERAAA